METFYNLKINGRIFEAVLSEGDDLEGSSFVVAPGVNGRGCIHLTFDSGDPDLCLQWFGYDPRCTKDPGMKRGFESKMMLVGALLAIQRLVGKKNLDRLVLEDKSSFLCPPRNSTDISTTVVSLLLNGVTYYQKLLGVSPSDKTVTDRLGRVLGRVSRDIETTFDVFWKYITQKHILQTRHNEDIAWLTTNAAKIQAAFDKSRSWRSFFKRVHKLFNCVFFECCFNQLSKMFRIDRIEGSNWVVALQDLPRSVEGREIVVDIEQVQDAGGRRQKVSNGVIRASAKLVEKVKKARVQSRRGLTA